MPRLKPPPTSSDSGGIITSSDRGPADAILTADVHLRADAPECRTDDFLAAMDRKLGFIRQLQDQNSDCPVLVAGDVFDRPRPPVWLVTWAMRRINRTDPWIAVPGQHDLPEHSLEQYELSGLAALEAAGSVETLGIKKWDTWLGDRMVFVRGFPWGADPKPIDRVPGHGDYRNVALVHRLVYSGDPPFPGAEKVGDSAAGLLRRMEGFDLMVTGDNHRTFVYATGNGGKFWIDPADDPRTAFALKDSFPGKQGMRLLVNPGSLMRTTADQANHEPCVFLWWAKTNEVQRVVVPHEKGVISREHIEKARARDERIARFAERLADGFRAGTGFEDNLRALLSNVDDEVVERLVWQAVEEGGK